jgi:hypothetical protein
MDDDSVGEEEKETNKTTAGGWARSANDETVGATDKGNDGVLKGDQTKYDEESNGLISIGGYKCTRCVGAGTSLSVCMRACACACTSKNVCRRGFFVGNPLPSVASSAICGGISLFVVVLCK